MATPFLDELEPVLAADPPAALAVFRRWLATEPAAMFAELRAGRPILQLPGLTVVSRYRDVVEVLSRELDFGIAPYVQKMERATGPFILGMEDSPAYERELSILRLASPRTDLPWLEARLAQWAEEAVAKHAAEGHLEMVQ